MLLRINNVRMSLVSEASLREAAARKLGVKKQDLVSVRVLRTPLSSMMESRIYPPSFL